jgi:hypothetical protein
MTTTTITCPSCGLAKCVPNEKLPTKSVIVTCPSCKGKFSFNYNKENLEKESTEDINSGRKYIIKNINCLIPILLLIGTTATSIVFTVLITVSVLIKSDLSSGPPIFHTILKIASALIVTFVVSVFWRKTGLYISIAKKNKERCFKNGQIILWFSNGFLLLYVIVPLFMTYVLGENNALLLWLGAVLVIPIYSILCIVGLIMVYTSKA